MDSVSKKVTELSFAEAKKGGMNIIDLILEFTTSAQKVAPGQGFEKITKDLKILKDQIHTCERPFLDHTVADSYVGLSLDQVMNWYEPIKSQLKKFYDAHMMIADFASKNPEVIDYDLLNICESRREQIIQVNEISNDIIPKAKSNKNDKSSIYALFFNHILKTESTEYAFIDALAEFVKTIRKHDPTVNINIREIFSVENAIPYTDSSGFITDGRAIRNLLGHNRFNLISNDTTWSIHFKNPYDQTFAFHKTYTADQFIEFISVTDLLYKSTFTIICLIILNGIIKNHFVRPPLFPLN